MAASETTRALGGHHAETLEMLLADSCEHTEHMEASLASTGPYMASLQRDVLPTLLANAKHLASLYAAIDAMEADVVPAVEASLGRMEAAATRLEAERAALEPSVATRVFASVTASWFGSGTAGEDVAEAREPWAHPELFEAAELMRLVRGASDGASHGPPKGAPRDGTGGDPGRGHAEEVALPASHGYEIRRPAPAGGGDYSVAQVGAKPYAGSPSKAAAVAGNDCKGDDEKAGDDGDGDEDEDEQAGDEIGDDEGEMVI
jgi:hypothetical protein